MTVLCVAGSHVIHVLQQTRRFKIISIDNFHNSHPAVYDRLNKIARDALPADATEQDKDSAEIDQYKIDLINAEDVRAVFERYGKGGIWGVIHIAVRPLFPLLGVSACASGAEGADAPTDRHTRRWGSRRRSR